MLAHLRRAVRRSTSTALDKGASAVEYGLLVAAIAAVIVGLVFGIGTIIKGAFEHTCEELAKHPGGGACVEQTTNTGGSGGVDGDPSTPE